MYERHKKTGTQLGRNWDATVDATGMQLGRGWACEGSVVVPWHTHWWWPGMWLKDLCGVRCAWSHLRRSAPVGLQFHRYEGKPVPIVHPQGGREPGGHLRYKGSAPIFITAPLKSIQKKFDARVAALEGRSSEWSMLLRCVRVFGFRLNPLGTWSSVRWSGQPHPPCPPPVQCWKGVSEQCWSSDSWARGVQELSAILERPSRFRCGRGCSDHIQGGPVRDEKTLMSPCAAAHRHRPRRTHRRRRHHHRHHVVHLQQHHLAFITRPLREGLSRSRLSMHTTRWYRCVAVWFCAFLF